MPSLFNFSETMLELADYSVFSYGQLVEPVAGQSLAYPLVLMPSCLYNFEFKYFAKLYCICKCGFNYKMNVLNELLAHVPAEQQQAYQAYLQTHLKLLMTSINKAKVQDLTQVQLRKNKCISQCYQSSLAQISGNSSQFMTSPMDTVEQIRQCKQRCGGEKKAVKKYLDDINYYSSLKLESCSKGCSVHNQYSKQYNQCIWTCYNKLDRRYKDYWVKQRVKIENRFKGENQGKL